MKDMATEFPGLGKVRARFLALLAERQTQIAHHALTAWESENPQEQLASLREASNVLHLIAGAGGSLGFDDLGETARTCEATIISHEKQAAENQCSVPYSVIAEIDGFVSLSQSVLDANT